MNQATNVGGYSGIRVPPNGVHGIGPTGFGIGIPDAKIVPLDQFQKRTHSAAERASSYQGF